jgi:phosphate transport system permease protein
VNTSTYGWRKFKDKLAFVLGFLCVILAMIPLASILFEVVRNGVSALSVEFLTSPPALIATPGGGAVVSGGIAVAIEGTLVMIGITALMAVPVGIMAGVYLAEYGNNRLGQSIRFLNDVLSQFPSIVIGLLTYSVVVLALHRFSAFAGGVALSIIMLPIVTRTTEESIKLVPRSVRDAAMALGIRKWRATASVVLSTARSGIVTGVLLSIARVSGESAPLIVTIGTSNFFFYGLDQQADALPLSIFKLSKEFSYAGAVQQGWGTALVLIILVLCLNLAVRLATRGKFGTVGSRL